MKFKTFRLLVAVGLVGSVGGAAWWIQQPSQWELDFAKLEQEREAKVAEARADLEAIQGGAGGEITPFRDFDKEVMRILANVDDKTPRVDVLQGNGPRINFYQDSYAWEVSRIRVDLDRDGLWDEKWVLEGNRVAQRGVSPQDDGKYTIRYKQSTDRWVPPDYAEPVAVAEAAAAGEGGATAGADGLRDFDRRILSILSEPARGEKLKDALGGSGPKVSLYHDDKSGYYNRLKIDLDRDEKWDEKWTVEKGTVTKRQVSPNDDDKYTLEYRLEGERWVDVNAPAAPENAAVAGSSSPALSAAGSSSPALSAAGAAGGAGAESATGGEGLRPFDKQMIELIAQPTGAEKMKDALGGGGAKINLYHDDKSGFFNRLKIDLDRDEKWDEKWTMAGGKVVKRQVAPADDEQYSVEYRLESGRWVTAK